MNDWDQWVLDSQFGEDLPEESHDENCPIAEGLGGPCTCEQEKRLDRPELICIGCGKKPSELYCYKFEAEDEGITADEYVWIYEGTLNRDNGHFLCDGCYIAAGMPSSPSFGWVAP